MMQAIRSKAGKLVTGILVLAFVGWMVFELGMDVSGTGGTGNPNILGYVKQDRSLNLLGLRVPLPWGTETPVTYQAYQAAYQELYQQAREQSGGELTAEQQRELDEAAWNRVVNDILLQQAMRRMGIAVSDQEVQQAILVNPHPALMQNELFQTDGQFDLRKYQEFLTGPTANQEIVFQLEDYYRQAIPQTKLLQRVTAGLFVSDAELWRAYQDRNETATVEYAALDLSRLAPGEVQVGADEIKRYYRANQDEFKRPASARLSLAILPKTLTAADTAATLERARQIRAEIVGGGDFAEVAQRESADPGSKAQGGDLGFFGRGQMIPAFEEVAFSTPVGEVSEPVLTDFGVHVIKVEERRDDQVRARHVLLPLEKSEEALDRLYARADSLEELAERTTLERAARATGATLRTGVTVSETVPFVPGIGSALEAVQWAGEEAQEEGAAKASEVLETDQALYVARLESYTPAGTIPLQEATPQIRRQLALEKREVRAREAGQKMVAEIRGGKSLQEVAAARGLSVERAGPFTRVDPNPVFGQANAAVGAAFGVPVGKVSDVVKTSGGLFIIRPVARTEADRAAWEAQKEQQRAMTQVQIRQEAFLRWLDSLRKQADIVDRREEVLRRSA